MSQVSHDSISTKQYGVNYYENLYKLNNKTDNVQKEVDNVAEKYTGHKEKEKTIENINEFLFKENFTDDEQFENGISDKRIKAFDKNQVGNKEKVQTKDYIENFDNEKNKTGDKKINKTDNNTIFKGVINRSNYETLQAKRNFKNDKKICVTIETLANKKTLQKRNNRPLWMIKASNVLKRRQFARRSRWSLNSKMLIFLVVLNMAGFSNAIDNSGFSSTLTSRLIASFLGYPSTCTLGAEVRPCTLTLTCWLRGGTRLRGCGGWLFSCCGPSETSIDGFDNSIQSSDWKYKMSPPKLRQVPQRSVMPNNVFRRRVDDDVTQMECGLPSSRILQKRIIGGREARAAEFPWQAHVRISEFQCGGVLVSRWFVATAAHCVSRARIRDIAVWLGAIDTSDTHYPARKIGVVQKILHPLFQYRMTQPDRYDIALLKLSRPITYMSHILPICLPDHDMELRGRSGVIAGWGKTDASSSHTGTNLLRSATVPILSKEQCINWHQSKQISVEIHSEMICAGHSDGHQDACLGDSGGPLIVFDNGRYYLVGITSAGFGCGVDHQPGIYHNVKLTANWIRGVITPSINYIDS